MDQSPTSEEQDLKASTNIFPISRGKSRRRWIDRGIRGCRDDAKNTYDHGCSRGWDYDKSQA